MGFADFPVPSGGYAGIFPVGIIDLQLDKLHVRMLRKQVIQEGRVRMEGETPVSDQAFFLLLPDKIPQAVGFILFHIGTLEGVEQVKVKIARAGAFQAGEQLPLGGSFILHDRGVDIQLGGEGIGIPRKTVRHRSFEGGFALATVVHIGRIKIGSAGGDELIRHHADLGDINAAIGQLRQAHETEAQAEWIQFE